MRPPSVYAKPSCPAGCACDVARMLFGPHRVAARLVMILLSCQRWPPAAIAELLGCDPATVRRWIHRYNTHGPAGLFRPAAGGPASVGQPPAGPAHPAAARPAHGLDDSPAVVPPWPSRHQPADPAPTGR